MLMEHTTIKEVADRAQVSTATVSRILSGKYRHRSVTVENVQRIIEELRMVRSTVPPEIKAPESVGVIMFAYRDFLNSTYNATLTTSIMEALTAENLAVQLIALNARNLSMEYIESLILAHHLRGLLIPEFDMLYAISEQLEKLPIPVIGIGNTAGVNLRRNVCSDDFRAGCDGANFLWSNGHRRFAVVSMARSDIGHGQRMTGFLDTMKQLGGDAGMIWSREFRSIKDSVSGWVSEFLNRRERPTALFCTNSMISQKIYAGLVQAGVRIPEDFSLLSVEEDGELEHLPVPISVLAQPTREIGGQAVTMLSKCLSGINPREREVMNFSLIIRKSVRKLSVS